MYVQTTHFKMETIHHLKEVVRRGDFVARLDLKDAFFTIPVAAADRRWLQFQWRGKRWQYTCLPFGLADAPRTFTKVMTPIAAILRQAGVRLLRYLDDWLFAGQSEDAVRQAVAAAVYLMERLGFTVNYSKSALTPVQELLFLGFIINTALWTLCLPSDKLKKLQHECRRVLRKNGATSTELRSILGTMEAARPATTPARLNMRDLQFLLQTAETNGDYAKMTIWASEDLLWWTTLSPEEVSRSISTESTATAPLITITSDASSTGWGAVSSGKTVSGHWRKSESPEHINWKELQAAFLGLRALASREQSTTIRMEMDNRTAVVYVNRQGGHIPSALPTRLGDVEVGSRAGSHPDSRPCARQGQYDCGPPLAANQRHGMGAPRRFLSATSSSAGTNVHRPFCGTTQCEVEALRELGTGPGCVGNGCILSGTRDLGGRVCVSAIQPRRTLPGEGKNYANQMDDPGSTGVAATVVVSNPAGDGVGETTAGPRRPSNIDLARDQNTPCSSICDWPCGPSQVNPRAPGIFKNGYRPVGCRMAGVNEQLVCKRLAELVQLV